MKPVTKKVLIGVGVAAVAAAITAGIVLRKKSRKA